MPHRNNDRNNDRNNHRSNHGITVYLVMKAATWFCFTTAGGPLVGTVAQRVGLRVAITSLTVLLLPVLPLFRLAQGMLKIEKSASNPLTDTN